MTVLEDAKSCLKPGCHLQPVLKEMTQFSEQLSPLMPATGGQCFRNQPFLIMQEMLLADSDPQVCAF